jgi:hypothetical protein
MGAVTPSGKISRQILPPGKYCRPDDWQSANAVGERAKNAEKHREISITWQISGTVSEEVTLFSRALPVAVKSALMYALKHKSCPKARIVVDIAVSGLAGSD